MVQIQPWNRSIARPYQCDVCKKSFSRYRELSEHTCVDMKETGGNYGNDEVFCCDSCYQTFPYYGDLSAHKKTCESRDENDDPSDSVRCSNADVRNVISSIIHEDDFTTIHAGTNNSDCRSDMVNKHDGNLSDGEPTPCNEKPEMKPELFHNMFAHRLKFPRKCAEFGFQYFEEKFHDTLHDDGEENVRKGSSKRRYVRRSSPKQMSGKLVARKKKRSFAKESLMKENLTNLPCSQCDKILKTRKTLEMHMKTHTGEKPFKCTVCGKSFSRKGNLQTHALFHTGEKPHKCERCGKGFRHISGFNYHVKEVSCQTKKRIDCSMCRKVLTSEKRLKRHLEVCHSST